MYRWRSFLLCFLGAKTFNFTAWFVVLSTECWDPWQKKITKEDDVIIWKHYPHYRPFVRGKHWSLVDFSHNESEMQHFDVFFVISLNKLLNKHSMCQWFEVPLCSCGMNVIGITDPLYNEATIPLPSPDSKLLMRTSAFSVDLLFWVTYLHILYWQATGLDARASRVKWPAQFMSHWYGILFIEW